MTESFRKIEDCAGSFLSRLKPLKASEWLDTIVAYWPRIVNSALSGQLVPERVWFRRPLFCQEGTLTVRALSKGAALVLQHESLRIVQAVNLFFKQEILVSVRVIA